MERQVTYDPIFANSTILQLIEDKCVEELRKYFDSEKYEVRKTENLTTFDCVIINKLTGKRVYGEIKRRSNGKTPCIGFDKFINLNMLNDDDNVYIFSLYDDYMAFINLTDFKNHAEKKTIKHLSFTTDVEGVKNNMIEEDLYFVELRHCKIIHKK